MTDMKLLYIASPYAGDIEYNTRKAIEYCRYAAERRYSAGAPLAVPKISVRTQPGRREMGIRMGLTLIAKCSELWVFGDKITTGMRRLNCGEPKGSGIPVKYISELEMTDYPRPMQQEPEETPSFGMCVWV